MLCHDPRISNQRDNRVETDNVALISVELQRQKYPGAEIDWESVAATANFCDERIENPERS